MDISDFSQTMSLSFLETLLRNNSLDSTLMISETIIKGLTDTLCCIKTANNLTDIELKHVFCPSICLAEVQLMCTGLRYSSLLFLKCRFALDLIHVSLIFFLETADWSIFVRAEIRSFQRSWSFWLKKKKKNHLGLNILHFISVFFYRLKKIHMAKLLISGASDALYVH